MKLFSYAKHRHAMRRFSKNHKGVAKAVKKYVKKQAVKTVINMAERKFLYLDTSQGLVGTPITTTLDVSAPTMYLINGMVQGDNPDQRNAYDIRMNKFRHNLSILQSVNTGITGNLEIRFIYFIYKNPRGVAPTPAQLLGATDPFIWADYNENNVEFKQRFRIIKDFIWRSTDHNILATQNVVTTGIPIYYNLPPVRHDFKNLKVTYPLKGYSSAGAGDITDMDENAFYLCILTNAPTTATVTINAGGYLFFNDI